MLEVPAPSTGVITKILVAEGKTVKAGTVLGILTEGEVAAAKPAAPASATNLKKPLKNLSKALI